MSELFSMKNLEEAHRLMLEMFEHRKARTGQPEDNRYGHEGMISLNLSSYMMNEFDPKTKIFGVFFNSELILPEENGEKPRFWKTTNAMLKQIRKWHEEEMSKPIPEGDYE